MVLKNREKSKRRNLAAFSPEPALKSSHKIFCDSYTPRDKQNCDIDEEEKKFDNCSQSSKEIVNSLKIHIGMIERIQNKLSEIKTSRYRLISLERLRRKIKQYKLANRSPYGFEIKKIKPFQG